MEGQESEKERKLIGVQKQLQKRDKEVRKTRNLTRQETHVRCGGAPKPPFAVVFSLINQSVISSEGLSSSL